MHPRVEKQAALAAAAYTYISDQATLWPGKNE